MGYKLEAGETLEAGFRRVIVEDIDAAIEALDRQPHLVAVHDVRKRIKRIRAALRLARAAVGEHTFRRENRAFRDIGRQLSEVRDAAILVESFNEMKPELAAPSLRNAVALVEGHVTRQQRATLTRLLTEEHAIEKTHAALSRARRRVQQWRLRGNQWPALRPGFTRTFAQGRTRFAAAYTDPSSERLHRWRKRVKDCASQTRLLEDLCPAALTAWADTGQALAAILGDDHDLAVLRLVISTQLGETLSPHDLHSVLLLIDRRRTQLVIKARPLGRRLYAEPPKQLVDRIEQYWNAWRLAGRAARQEVVSWHTDEASSRPGPARLP